MLLSKNETRKRRKVRIRKKISGTAERPRLVVYRSNLHIYAQVVDDATGATLAATSTLSLSKGGEKAGCNKAGADRVGKEIARLALGKGHPQSGVRPQRLSLPRPHQGGGPTVPARAAWNSRLKSRQQRVQD